MFSSPTPRSYPIILPPAPPLFISPTVPSVMPIFSPRPQFPYSSPFIPFVESAEIVDREVNNSMNSLLRPSSQLRSIALETGSSNHFFSPSPTLSFPFNNFDERMSPPVDFMREWSESEWKSTDLPIHAIRHSGTFSSSNYQLILNDENANARTINNRGNNKNYYNDSNPNSYNFAVPLNPSPFECRSISPFLAVTVIPLDVQSEYEKYQIESSSVRRERRSISGVDVELYQSYTRNRINNPTTVYQNMRRTSAISIEEVKDDGMIDVDDDNSQVPINSRIVLQEEEREEEIGKMSDNTELLYPVPSTSLLPLIPIEASRRSATPFPPLPAQALTPPTTTTNFLSLPVPLNIFCLNASPAILPLHVPVTALPLPLLPHLAVPLRTAVDVSASGVLPLCLPIDKPPLSGLLTYSSFNPFSGVCILPDLVNTLPESWDPKLPSSLFPLSFHSLLNNIAAQTNPPVPLVAATTVPTSPTSVLTSSPSQYAPTLSPSSTLSSTYSPSSSLSLSSSSSSSSSSSFSSVSSTSSLSPVLPLFTCIFSDCNSPFSRHSARSYRWHQWPCLCAHYPHLHDYYPNLKSFQLSCLNDKVLYRTFLAIKFFTRIQKNRRPASELREEEKWVCEKCGKFMRKTSNVSIKKHKKEGCKKVNNNEDQIEEEQHH